MNFDDVQRPIAPPVSSAILDEVIGPDMVRTFRLEAHARSIVQPEPSLLSLLLWDLQPFTSPDALDPLVVHMPASVVQQTRHHAITIAVIYVGQFNDIIAQPLFFSTALRNLSLCRTVLPQGAAGAALGYAKLLPHMVDAFAAARRAQKFPRETSVRMSLSSVRSDTARRSLWFSFSSSLSRLS